MTPTPAASQVDQSRTLPFPRSTGELVGGEVTGLLDPPSWSKVRLLVDVVVLYVASSLALFADPRISGAVASRWLAAIFPLIVLAFLYAGKAPGRPSERFSGRLDHARARGGFARRDADDRAGLDRRRRAPRRDGGSAVAVRRGVPGGGAGRSALGPQARDPNQRVRDPNPDRGCRASRGAPGQAARERSHVRPAPDRIPRRRPAAELPPGRPRVAPDPRRPPRPGRGSTANRRPARDPRVLDRARPRPRRPGQGVRATRRRRLADSPAVRVDQRPRDARPRRRAAADDAPPDESARLAVHGQARVRPGVRLYGSRPAQPRAGGLRARCADELTRPDPVPPAARRQGWMRVHDAQVPHDARRSLAGGRGRRRLGRPDPRG